MNNKQQEHNKKMEEKLAALKANHVDSPTQAKARKLVKPIFITIGLIFTLLFVALIVDSGSNQKTVEVTSTEKASVPIKIASASDAEKWQALKGVSDCELAYRMYSDYAPIIASLSTFVEQNPNMTHQQAVQWKLSSQFEEKIALVEAKYPLYYNVNMENAILAHGFNFSAGQYWRDIFSVLRHSPAGTPIVSEQTTLMQDDLDLLESSCLDEFKN
ncbi:hypothetical protein CXF86_11090 [Shewanella sp. GutCb]|uniref:hypothetical protein n=1 Tax=Shewanella sp. GutCb TaxID=2058315 RepID=UPI000C7D3497|nr:hypothetical protein [Shewanella sp. GutCb]PKG74827.1 hypothetical protein CXF86_11090 [Shewanella sp. GutCb]